MADEAPAPEPIDTTLPELRMNVTRIGDSAVNDMIRVVAGMFVDLRAAIQSLNDRVAALPPLEEAAPEPPAEEPVEEPV